MGNLTKNNEDQEITLTKLVKRGLTKLVIFLDLYICSPF